MEEKSQKKIHINSFWAFASISLMFLFSIFSIVLLTVRLFEREILSLAFIIALGIYFLIIFNFIYYNSSNKFLKENGLIIQFTLIFLFSIVLGLQVTNSFYPVNLPYTIEMGPIHYHPYENKSVVEGSPAITLKCSSNQYKNFIDEGTLKCETKQILTGTLHEIEIEYLILSENSHATTISNLTSYFEIILNKGSNYTLEAKYPGGNIHIEPFKQREIFTKSEYEEIKQKRITLVGVFIVFSLGILSSFVKNINEMLKRE